MIRAYCGVPSECNEETAHKFNSLLERIGIKIVFMHAESILSAKLFTSADEIDTAERRDPEGNNFPVQPNCFYSYVPLVTTPTSRHQIVGILQHPTKEKSCTVYLNWVCDQLGRTILK